MRRKQIGKITSLIMAAALTMSMVSGCSTSKESTSSATTAAATTKAQEEAKTETTEEAKAEASAEKEVTLRLVHYMGEQTKRDALDLMLAAFEEEYPHIKVEVEVVSSSSYIATYKNYIAAGEAPDIMFGKPQTLTEFVEGGYFKDLTGEPCLDNVLTILTDECTVDGGIYGFPMDAQVKCCFYNKDMFAELGLEVPTTKDEFFAVCDAFMAEGIYPMVHPYNFIHGVFHELDSCFTVMAAETGNPNIWAESQAGTINLAESEVMIDAIETFSRFASYQDPGDTAVDQTQGIQNFAAEQRPMYMNGGWLMGDAIAANPEGNFGMFPTPWSDDPEDSKLWVGIDDSFIVSSQSEHPEETMTLLEFFANDECSKIWMSVAKLMSSNVNVSTDEADPMIQEIKTYIDNDKIVAKCLVPDYTSEYSTAFRTKFQEFVTWDDDKRDAVTFLESVDAEMASIRQ